MVHFVIPNNTEYHCLAIGTWLCEAICSLGDPGVSVSVLKTQMIDTNAKFVICYQNSRRNVYKALEELDLLGKVQVVVMENAIKNEDFVMIDEPGFSYFEDFVEKAETLPQPPLLQDGETKDSDTFAIFWSSGTTGRPKGKRWT